MELGARAWSSSHRGQKLGLLRSHAKEWQLFPLPHGLNLHVETFATSQNSATEHKKNLKQEYRQNLRCPSAKLTFLLVYRSQYGFYHNRTTANALRLWHIFFLTSASAAFSSSSRILKSNEKKKRKKTDTQIISEQTQGSGVGKTLFLYKWFSQSKEQKLRYLIIYPWTHLRVQQSMSTLLLFACLQYIRCWASNAKGTVPHLYAI